MMVGVVPEKWQELCQKIGMYNSDLLVNEIDENVKLYNLFFTAFRNRGLVWLHYEAMAWGVPVISNSGGLPE
jgi:hypothetical protein